MENSHHDTVETFLECERDPHREPEVRITGLMVQYYHVCQRELWFMSRGIDIDRDTANIRRGSRVDERSYRDQKRSFQINDRIAVDMLDDGRLMEVKVSSTLEKPPKMQLLYYMWYLDRVYGIKRDGVLAYPEERKREAVQLSSENVERIEETVEGIIEVVTQKEPPSLEKKPYCDSCLYQDICWL